LELKYLRFLQVFSQGFLLWGAPRTQPLRGRWSLERRACWQVWGRDVLGYFHGISLGYFSNV
jgi:hypothetical protein